MKAKTTKKINWLATVLLIIGGLNWGLAVFDFNLVTMIFGSIPTLVTVIYSAVGISAVWSAYRLFAK